MATSLLLAGGAAYMANKWITARAVPVSPVAMTNILTAAMNLQLGTKIEARHVSSMVVMPGQEPAGTFHDIKDIEGKVTTVNVPAGQIRTGAIAAETILSNVKVLAVDQTASSNSNEPVVVRAVTLELTPTEGETLLKGKAQGSIQLALRNPLDESDARRKEAPVRVVKVAAPVKDPSITVIRGTSVNHDAPHQ